MSIRRLCMALIVLMALVAPVNAQDEMTNTLTFNNLSLSFEATLATGVTVEQVAATPVSDNQPFFESAPAHTQFTLLNYAGLVDDPSAAILQPRLQMFNTADFAQYSFFADQLAQLETLLKDQPDLSPYMAASMPGQSAENLPYLPAVNAAQVFRAHAHYLETGDWRGVAYLTYFSQAMMPVREGEVFYTFQGISADEQHYLAATLPVRAGLSDPGAVTDDYPAYLQQLVDQLNAQSQSDFTPDLDTLDALVTSVAVQ